MRILREGGEVMSKSARVRSLISSLFLFSIFAELSLVELLVVWLTNGHLSTSSFVLISIGAFLFYSLAYLSFNRILHRKLKRRQITADDYRIESRIPSLVYAGGFLSFFFLHAQLLPFSTFFEMLFNGLPQPDIYHYISLDSFFGYEVQTFAHQYLESSSWLFNSNLFVSIIGLVALVFELIVAIQAQKKAESNRAH